LRDARRCAEAAEAYCKALAVAPQRTDIRVQYANMLKDSGRPADAEGVYRAALAESPDDADIYLQLGHCLKLQGTRRAAFEAYERATELSAFPVGRYDRFRRAYDVPPAPRIPTALSFVVLLLADRETIDTIRAQIAAIGSQTYWQWRLYVIGTDPNRRRITEQAAENDARIGWSEVFPGESAACAERRVGNSTGSDWILLLAEKALLHPRALEWFATVAGCGAATAFVADEEIGARECGMLRPTRAELRQVVDYDTLLEMNTLGETVAVERECYAAVASSLAVGSVAAARSSLLLALARDGRLGHIPCPLVCRDGDTVLDPTSVARAHEEALRAHLTEADLGERIEIGPPTGSLPRLAILWRPPNPDEPMMVIIPTRDNGADVSRFIASLREQAAAPEALNIVVVDNGSRQPETCAILDAIAATERARVIAVDEPFNWSRLNNRATELGDSPLLVFANDDMLMLSERWDDRLRGLLGRPEIGAVGARLLYEDGTVQHAGVLFGWDGSVIHDGLYESSVEPGPSSRWQVTRAVSAVTGAFLATRRDVFLAHCGFDEAHLAVSYGDIDYALKLRASGLRVLWTPDIVLYHHESKTRGLDYLDAQKRAREAAEQGVMHDRWGPAMATDPSINPIWRMAILPFRLLSAPSPSRLWAHIERCARDNPWLPVGGEHRALSPSLESVHRSRI
jgi:O-antigen biosynthesis protein